ncbi:MAG: cobalt ECF transporter T component CbiQ [Rhodocyclales bacterium]|nr:cobalt ECF transporter T component CbiQ [Rhodocyclales bacterium]
MLIEQSAYANRWRRVSPVAKGSFALAGLVAAFVAASPLAAGGVALLLALATCLAAGVPPGRYLRVAAPALAFLALSCLSLLFSLAADADGGLAWQWAPQALPRIATVATRALAALAALLLLVLTTPPPDLIALLRSCRVPEVLLDLMVLCYRMLFVFSAAVRDTLTAQAARLGHATVRGSLRSLGLLAASLTVQIWRRALALHRAALARNGDGPLRMLPAEFADAGRHTALAVVAGGALIAFAARGLQ